MTTAVELAYNANHVFCEKDLEIVSEDGKNYLEISIELNLSHSAALIAFYIPTDIIFYKIFKFKAFNLLFRQEILDAFTKIENIEYNERIKFIIDQLIKYSDYAKIIFRESNGFCKEFAAIIKFLTDEQIINLATVLQKYNVLYPVNPVNIDYYLIACAKYNKTTIPFTDDMLLQKNINTFILMLDSYLVSNKMLEYITFKDVLYLENIEKIHIINYLSSTKYKSKLFIYVSELPDLVQHALPIDIYTTIYESIQNNKFKSTAQALVNLNMQNELFSAIDDFMELGLIEPQELFAVLKSETIRLYFDTACAKCNYTMYDVNKKIIKCKC
jgi:hypothetical protein